jgi:hypothetical protein
MPSVLEMLARFSGGRIRQGRRFVTGLEAIDRLLPAGGFQLGAIHEVLTGDEAEPAARPRLYRLAMTFAMTVARAAADEGAIVWCDPKRWVYPPALAQRGIGLDRVYLLRAGNPRDEMWAVTQCLRCKGVRAVIAAAMRLSDIEARRLQLAVEHGGGVGILMRPAGDSSGHYAAATRWLVRPAAGEERLQRWEVELIHGHGGCINQSVILEVCRETHHVRAFEKLADRSSEQTRTRVPA